MAIKWQDMEQINFGAANNMINRGFSQLNDNPFSGIQAIGAAKQANDAFLKKQAEQVAFNQFASNVAGASNGEQLNAINPNFANMGASASDAAKMLFGRQDAQVRNNGILANTAGQLNTNSDFARSSNDKHNSSAARTASMLQDAQQGAAKFNAIKPFLGINAKNKSSMLGDSAAMSNIDAANYGEKTQLGLEKLGLGNDQITANMAHQKEQERIANARLGISRSKLNLQRSKGSSGSANSGGRYAEFIAKMRAGGATDADIINKSMAFGDKTTNAVTKMLKNNRLALGNTKTSGGSSAPKSKAFTKLMEGADVNPEGKAALQSYVNKYESLGSIKTKDGKEFSLRTNKQKAAFRDYVAQATQATNNKWYLPNFLTDAVSEASDLAPGGSDFAGNLATFMAGNGKMFAPPVKKK
jgi:hypothetical protein